MAWYHDAERKRLARSMWDAGYPAQEIGAACSVSAGSIQAIATAHAWPKDVRKANRKARRVPAEARVLYESGAGIQEICSRFGVKDTAVYNWARRMGWDAEVRRRASLSCALHRTPTEKFCRGCRRTRPAADFYTRRHSNGRLEVRVPCRQCKARRRRLRWGAHTRASLKRRSRFREHLRRVAKALGSAQDLPERECPRCTSRFIPVTLRQVYCSDQCSWREQRSRRRARQRSAFVERVDLIDIYKRDGGRCGLCGRKVDRRCKYPHSRAPVLDHIVPLSRGGKHERINIQLAHHGCNDRKQTTACGSQLILLCETGRRVLPGQFRDRKSVV